MFNKDDIKGKWLQIKGEVMKSWGNMTDDEVEKFKGNISGLAGEIQRKYGHAKEDVEKKLNEIAQRFSKTANDKWFDDETEERPRNDVPREDRPQSGLDV